MTRMLIACVVVLALLAVTVRSSETDTKADALLTAAKAAQERVEKVSEEMYQKLADVEKEYRLKRRPLLKERSAAAQKIPGFWKKSIVNHPSHRNWVTDADIAALEFLEDVEITDLDDQFDGHYKIALTFKPNALFKDTTVWRNVPSAPDTQEFSGVQWTAKQEGTPYTLMAFFDGTMSDHGLVSEVAHAVRYDIYVNPFPYYDYVEPEAGSQQAAEEQEQPDEGSEAQEGTEEFYQGGDNGQDQQEGQQEEASEADPANPVDSGTDF